MRLTSKQSLHIKLQGVGKACAFIIVAKVYNADTHTEKRDLNFILQVEITLTELKGNNPKEIQMSLLARQYKWMHSLHYTYSNE